MQTVREMFYECLEITEKPCAAEFWPIREVLGTKIL